MSRGNDKGGASALPTLELLAEAAAHWLEADALLDMGDPTNEQLDHLSARRDRIVTEATSIPATTRADLRYKAQVLARLERAALADDASMSPASLALLQSLLADLIWENDAV